MVDVEKFNNIVGSLNNDLQDILYNFYEIDENAVNDLIENEFETDIFGRIQKRVNKKNVASLIKRLCCMVINDCDTLPFHIITEKYKISDCIKIENDNCNMHIAVKQIRRYRRKK